MTSCCDDQDANQEKGELFCRRASEMGGRVGRLTPTHCHGREILIRVAMGDESALFCK